MKNETTFVRMRSGDHLGAYAERFLGGSPNSAGGLGDAVSPPNGVRDGGPEDFEINAFQRLRTPVSLSFLSQCCYTKIHATVNYRYNVIRYNVIHGYYIILSVVPPSSI